MAVLEMGRGGEKCDEKLKIFLLVADKNAVFGSAKAGLKEKTKNF
jgi:hypothetical protein